MFPHSGTYLERVSSFSHCGWKKHKRASKNITCFLKSHLADYHLHPHSIVQIMSCLVSAEMGNALPTLTWETSKSSPNQNMAMVMQL